MATHSRDQVDALTRQAYARWAGFLAPASLDACTHCMDEVDQETLRALPVSTIPAPLLWDYHCAAHDKVTPLSEVLHFLPRYLDLLAQFIPHNALGYEATLSRIAWDDLPADDQAFLQRWADAYARLTLLDQADDPVNPPADSARPQPDELLIMLARAGIDVTGILDSVRLATSEAAITSRLQLVATFDMDTRQLTNPWAHALPGLNATIGAWIATLPDAGQP